MTTEEDINQLRADIANINSKDILYRPDAQNLLGRQQKKARDLLYAKALDKPSVYVEKRAEMISKFTDTMIDQMNLTFYNILAHGKDKNGVQLMTYPDGRDYVPGIPKATITAFCVKVDETIEDMCEEAFQMMYPRDHKTLAEARIASANSDGNVAK